MIELKVDVAVVGSGFGGSLTALLLERIGLNPALIDRGSHPRFAIGESSTPNADLVLLGLARKYDLPRIAPLAKFGTWQQHYPEIGRGLKRGFSYFHHQRGKPFRCNDGHTNELLVAASPDDARSDTHWLRADVDSFFAHEAQRAGVPLLEKTTVKLAREGPGWILTGLCGEEPVRIEAQFLVDATGEYGLVPRTLGIASRTATLATNSRTIFAHFQDLLPWQRVLEQSGASTADHPFSCDDAALHQVIDEGWMYQLRFTSGVTSAGFVLDANEGPLDDAVSIQQEWTELLDRYPSLTDQFRHAVAIAPEGGLRRTGRLQRRMARIAGDNWVLLPHTAGFIDPLHSTGIAQTLCGIERLIAILRENWHQPQLPSKLAEYAEIVDRELLLIDKLVSGCYLARRDFRLFTAFSMLYFAAATASEHRRATGQFRAGAAFLCADEPDFAELVANAWEQVKSLASRGCPATAEVARFEQFIARGLGPYNIAGLCDPAVRNMYRYTAAKKP
jgi:FADH2 O2-dependent halogenase